MFIFVLVILTALWAFGLVGWPILIGFSLAYFVIGTLAVTMLALQDARAPFASAAPP